MNKIKAVKPEVCSHCGDALCVATRGCAHYIALSHHQTGGGHVNEHCTRAELVKVRDCGPLRDDGCPWWHRANGGLVYCDLADLHILPSLKVGLPTNQLKGGKACPLMEDGKPGPGVKIVAIKEGEG